MNVALIGLFILAFKEVFNGIFRLHKSDQLLLLAVVSYLLIDVFYSLMMQAEPGLIFRFLLILLLIALAYFIMLPKKIIGIFLWLNVIQAVFVTLLALGLVLFFSPKEALMVRFFFLDQNWGDVYSLNGWLYKVQIKGNGLLPVAFFLTYLYRIKRVLLIRGILFAGCVFAGNFAFLISIGLFSFMFFLKAKSVDTLFRKIFLVVICLLFFSYPVYTYYVKDVLESKQQGSLGTRYDQARVLMDDLTEDPVTTIFGQGIGHTVEVITPYRDYRGKIFYELQTLYILNQLGILGFTIFILYNLRLIIINYKKSGLLLLYLCYVLYSITNPYIFDSGHIAVILLLNSLSNYET